MLILIAAILGAVLALGLDIYIPSVISRYVAIAIIAALDTILGGTSAIYEKRFNFIIFITGLVGNALLSAVLVFIGQKLGVDIYLAAIVVFVMRIFKNIAIIRFHIVEKYEQNKLAKTGKNTQETVETD